MSSETGLNSPTFCVLPWVQMASKPDGTLNLCCLASHIVLKDENSRAHRMDEDSFEHIWNCDELKATRKKMCAGEKVNGCQICYNNEANKQESLRQSMNRRWKGLLGAKEIKRRIEESESSGGQLTSQPVYWDLRLGNKCNLKCRMCFPINSHGLNQEFAKIREEGKDFPSYDILSGQQAKDALHWGDSEKFQESMIKVLPFARELYFTGGELMLIQTTYNILQAAVDLNVAHDIQIKFHTNTTIWNAKVMELLPHFKDVDIICSIDGAENTDDYIRYPTKFSVVNDNLKKYLDLAEQHANIFIAVSAAISWQNVFDLPQFAKWILSFNLPKRPQFRGVYYNLVYFPTFLSFKMIPSQLRTLAIESVIETVHLHDAAQFMTPHIEQSLNALLHVLRQEPEYSEHERRDLITQTEVLDQTRAQNLKSLIPSAYPVYQFHKEGSRSLSRDLGLSI